MTEQRRELISEISSIVRNDIALTPDAALIDLNEIIDNLGGRLQYFTGNEQYEKVEKGESDGFVIWINEGNSQPRQRFSIAHELGHLYLHMSFGEDEWDEIESGTSYNRIVGIRTGVEEDANEFAASFLMPTELFTKIAESHSDDESFFLDPIAEAFGVPVTSVINRGRNVGLWE